MSETLERWREANMALCNAEKEWAVSVQEVEEAIKTRELNYSHRADMLYLRARAYAALTPAEREVADKEKSA